VKEYLQKPDVWANLLSLTKSENFDASLALLRAKILMLKIPTTQETSESILACALSLALKAEDSTGTAHTALLDEMDATAGQIYSEGIYGTRIEERHWSSSTDFDQLWHLPRSRQSFLIYAARNGLTLYVQAKIASLNFGTANQVQRSLLDYATWFREPAIRPAMVAMLLQAGFDPNDGGCKSRRTPWEELINYISIQKDTSTFNQSWIDVCKLFIISGADLKVKIRTSWTAGQLSISDVLRWAFRCLPQGSVSELGRMITHREERDEANERRERLSKPHFRDDANRRANHQLSSSENVSRHQSRGGSHHHEGYRGGRQPQQNNHRSPRYFGVVLP
jgi:hypothetical protein